LKDHLNKKIMKDKDKDRLFQFPFVPADFLVSTMLMTPAEVGAFMRLLCHSWLEDGIPYKSKTYLARLGGVSTSKLDQILSKFYIDDENRLRHHRLEVVRKNVVELREKRVKAGRKGGEANKQRFSPAEAKWKQKSSIAEPSKTKQNKTKQKGTPLPPLSVAETIAAERALRMIAEDITEIKNQSARDAMGSVITWGHPDDRERLRELRARERELKAQLTGITPRRESTTIPAGMAELAGMIAEDKLI
jgi:uncharacterized protein YdaU (DUF1376 family)